MKLGGRKVHLLPLGGDPPENAWLKKEYKDSQEVVPLTPTRIANKANNFFTKVGTAIGSTRKNSRQKVNVIHAALVVARRQYIPTQNTAAKSIGTIHVNCRLANMS
ncbi:MAG: hypothetical protein JKX86_01470 [Verrucomicrobiales bacterium]|nr:hypothetical protein [Verrucomicrobiales bacterium]